MARAHDGAATGFDPGRTLPYRVELRRQFSRTRTRVSFGLLAALPFILAVAFALGPRSRTAGTFIDLATSGAFNFTVVNLFFSSSFLLVVIVSLFFGDTVASEAQWSSLKYLLAVPVPRLRLLRQKVLVAATLTVASVVLLAVTALVVGAVLYGWNEFVHPAGVALSPGVALGRVALIVGFLLVNLAWVAGLALLLSVSTDAPLGAVGGAVLLTILSQILDQIDALGSIREFLPTRFAFAWVDALSNPIGWDGMLRGMTAGAVYGLVLAGLAAWIFRSKDITS